MTAPFQGRRPARGRRGAGSRKPASLRALRTEERGAEAVEFALIAPILFFLVFGLIYVLLLFVAQLSLGHAAAVGVRYASIPDAGRNYPAPAQVKTRMLASAPLFSPSMCNVPTLTGGAEANAEMILSVTCNFPNPAGAVAGRIRSIFYGGSTISPTVTLSAEARARKE